MFDNISQHCVGFDPGARKCHSEIRVLELLPMGSLRLWSVIHDVNAAPDHSHPFPECLSEHQPSDRPVWVLDFSGGKHQIVAVNEH